MQFFRGTVLLLSLLVVAGCARKMRQLGLVQPTAQQLAADKRFQWHATVNQNVHVYYQNGVLINGEVPSSLATMLRVVTDTLRVQDTRPVHAFIVKSPNDIMELVGHRVPGRSYPGTRVFVMVADSTWRTTAMHELVHIVAGSNWGGTEQWLSEGLATYIGNPFYGREPHRLAFSELLRKNRWVTLYNLRHHFGDYTDDVSYLAAASAAKFLYERYGAADVAQIWKNPGSLPGVTGRTWEQIEAQWQEEVRN
jgi:hypothetical protein